MADSQSLRFVTYNMHGFNQGCQYLKHLCTCADIIFIQEHWLYPFNLNLLHDVCPDFVCYSSSAMRDAVDAGIVVGRPFGGVAILVRSSIAVNCRLICEADRYIAVRLFDSVVVDVYMPCKSVSDYVEVYCETLAQISETISNYMHCPIVCGVFNFDFNAGGPLLSYITEFTDGHKLVPTYSFLQETSPQTYRHSSLQAASLIDHFLVSNVLVDHIHRIRILDDACNLSDHLPVVMSLSMQNSVSPVHTVSDAYKLDLQRLRWDKADLFSYYNLISISLCSTCTVVLLHQEEGSALVVAQSKHCIEQFYNDIVMSLTCSANYTVPKCKQNFFQILVG